MNTELYCQEVLTTYPEYVSKEQMRKICHIRKSTCLFLLENNLVPNIDNGKATHRFKIKITDVVEYLRQRELHPAHYRPIAKRTRAGTAVMITEKQLLAFRQSCELKLARKPDLLTATDICKFTGYTASAVTRWRSKGYLRYLMVNNRFLYPKEYLLDFLCSSHFLLIRKKSRKHIALMKQFLAIHHQ